MFYIVIFVFATCTYGATGLKPMDQASKLLEHRFSNIVRLVSGNYQSITRDCCSLISRHYDDHLLNNGLPGQPKSGVNFKQYAGDITVNHSTGRALFYYFVESSVNSSTKPLILWLNGGPGCSSLGMGAFTEIGPFGVNPDGQTLYHRQFAWNKVANVLFLESPVGVGFSYSNTTSDYNPVTDQRTSEDTYIFLMEWFKRYPSFKGRDFYLIGESYAGYFIPELANIILDQNDNKGSKDSPPMINIQGIMIGNGLIDDQSDTSGLIDFAWSHSIVSDESRDLFLKSCSLGNLNATADCIDVIDSIMLQIGNINYFNLYSPSCDPSLMNHPPTGRNDPCDILYVRSYLNLPHVQAALNANKTKLTHSWEPCSHVIQWKDIPLTMFPIYERLMAHGLRIMLYSGDVDACVPVTGTRYAIARMGLKVIKPWHWWSIFDTLEVAGYEVTYDGLRFVTVKGAGHEVAVSNPNKLYHLMKSFVGKLG